MRQSRVSLKTDPERPQIRQRVYFLLEYFGVLLFLIIKALRVIIYFYFNSFCSLQIPLFIFSFFFIFVSNSSFFYDNSPFIFLNLSSLERECGFLTKPNLWPRRRKKPTFSGFSIWSLSGNNSNSRSLLP